MSTRLEIVNGVLRLLGKPPEQSLNYDSDLAKSIDYSIDSMASILLLKNDWMFAIKICELNTPNTCSFSPEYKNTFELPYDFGRIHRFMCQCNCCGCPCFEIINRVMLSNLDKVCFYYVIDHIKDCEGVPSYFARLLSYLIAEDMCLAHTENYQLSQLLSIKYHQELASAISYNNVNRPFLSYKIV